MADYDLVWWVPAEQILLARSSLANLAGQLGVPSSSDINRTVDNVLQELCTGRPYARWLLVYDNGGQSARAAAARVSTSAWSTWTRRSGRCSYRPSGASISPRPALRARSPLAIREAIKSAVRVASDVEAAIAETCAAGAAARAGACIQQVIGEAERELGIPRAVSESSIATALSLDSTLDQKTCDDFLERVFAPEANTAS